MSEEANQNPMAPALAPSKPPAMPASIAKAIVGVMKEIPKLTKGQINTHGSYNFASIDDFLEAVRPLCANNGLVIVQQEDELRVRERQTKSGASQWLVIDFSFWFFHESGDFWEYALKRTGMVDASMGSQALGAAQSYALKQMMRSLFQIATGDEKDDADSHKHGPLPPDPSLAMRTTVEWEATITDAKTFAALSKAGQNIATATNAGMIDDAAMKGLRSLYEKRLVELREAKDKNGKNGKGEKQKPAAEAEPVEPKPAEPEALPKLENPAAYAAEWIAALESLPTEQEVRDYLTDHSVWEYIEASAFDRNVGARLEDAINSALTRVEEPAEPKP